MSFHTSAVCDGCDKSVLADNEDQLVEFGWLLVRYGHEDEEITKDFCKLPCLLKWASRGSLSSPDPSKGILGDEGVSA